MKRITAPSVLVFLMAFAAPAFSQSFVGEWTATATAPAGNFSETLAVVKVGNGFAITAKLVDVPIGTPEAGPGTDIVLDGDRFFYKRTLTTPDGTLVITYSGIVSEDTFTGTVDMGFAKVPYTGLRIKRSG